MSAAALPTPTPAVEPDLAIKDVLRDTGNLYKRLFRRSVGLGLLVFGPLSLVREGMSHATAIPPIVRLAVVVALTVTGTALVQGALAESVRDIHVGAEPVGIFASYERAAARLGSLVGVALLTSVAIGIGFVFFIIPGFILLTRFAVAVPIVMYEGASPRDALRRSKELVKGHGRAVFTVLINVSIRVGLFSVAISLLAQLRPGFIAFWLTATIAAALTTPYTAHTLSVLYYRLTEPERPMIPEPGDQRWHSVWHDQDA